MEAAAPAQLQAALPLLIAKHALALIATRPAFRTPCRSRSIISSHAGCRLCVLREVSLVGLNVGCANAFLACCERVQGGRFLVGKRSRMKLAMLPDVDPEFGADQR
jgi:hypothetical protein